MFCITMAGAYYHGAAPWPVYMGFEAQWNEKPG
jgi:hypothetical protein